MEQSARDLCNNYDGNMNVYNHILHTLDCSNKKINNIRNHLHICLTEDKVDDKGILFLQYIIKQESIIQELRSKVNSQNIDFNPYIDDIKQSIESSNDKHINRYESYAVNIADTISKIENQQNIFTNELLEDYKQLIGTEITNYKPILNPAPKMRLIYSRRNYLQYINLLDADILKGTGIQETQLRQYKNELLKNKELDKYR